MTQAIDLFAGAGGFTTGAVAAGAEVLWAANHWEDAVRVHELNHPEVTHACQDIMQADWGLVPDHDLLLASPACQGHSTAGQPGRVDRARVKHENDRNTAWAVVGCAEARRPRTILVENVPLFRRWALFEPWVECLRRLGYVVRCHVFDAADFGVPQNRKRLVVSARLGEALDLVSPDLEHRPFRECVDLDAGTWAPVASKPEGVRRRVQRAWDRGHRGTFLTQHVTGHPGRSLDRPIGTITTKDHWAIVRGDQIRMLVVDEARRGMGFPGGYELPEARTKAIRLLGNAIPPLMAQELVSQAL